VPKISIEDYKGNINKEYCVTTNDNVHFHVVPRFLSTWVWFKMNLNMLPDGIIQTVHWVISN